MWRQLFSDELSIFKVQTSKAAERMALNAFFSQGRQRFLAAVGKGGNSKKQKDEEEIPKDEEMIEVWIRARQHAPSYRFGTHLGIGLRFGTPIEMSHHRSSSSPPFEAQTPNKTPTGKIKLTWTRHLEVILRGTRDQGSPWSLLQGYEETIVKQIYFLLFASWKNAVILTPPAHTVARIQTLSPQALGPNDDFAVREPSFIRSLMLHPGRNSVENYLLHGQQMEDRILMGSKISDRPEIAYTCCGNVQFPRPRGRNVNMLGLILYQMI